MGARWIYIHRRYDDKDDFHSEYIGGLDEHFVFCPRIVDFYTRIVDFVFSTRIVHKLLSDKLLSDKLLSDKLHATRFVHKLFCSRIVHKLFCPRFVDKLLSADRLLSSRLVDSNPISPGHNFHLQWHKCHCHY